MLTACGNTSENKKTNSADKQVVSAKKVSDPYKNLSKQSRKLVQVADKAVAKVVAAKLAIVNNNKDKLSTDELNALINKAQAKIAAIKGESKTLKVVRQTYTDILTVAKKPSLEALQATRTTIANLKDSALAQHIKKTVEKSLIKIVAKISNVTDKKIAEESKVGSATQASSAQQTSAASTGSGNTGATAQSNSQYTAPQSSTTSSQRTYSGTPSRSSNSQTNSSSSYRAPASNNNAQKADSQASQNTGKGANEMSVPGTGYVTANNVPMGDWF
ncbi:hypothetical protein WDC_0335 [Paucilactobacillus wasatchensis]|uniref:Uncharacterized protein n=2 Tax=Paucilactobacillus wasatchensis TaxID=1335616 RepID=A0A0D1ABB5_9LACO|nr:hypothetical protein WDC_0335 [Paucilactobacillus wasatchensis]